MRFATSLFVLLFLPPELFFPTVKSLAIPTLNSLAPARENGKLVKSVKDDQTQEILASMISTTKINKSSRLANSIQNHLYQSMSKKYSGVKNLGVKEGPFFVLHDTNMASILVEVGFVTNLKEESRLKKSSYLDMLASSIARGISKFVQDFDPMI